MILIALAVAAVVLVRGFGEGARAEPPPVLGPIGQPASLEATPSQPRLAATVPRPVPLHIFTGPPARVHARALPPATGDEYALALTRDPGGRWVSVLRGPSVTTEGGVLTVTLVVPWSELAERFSAVNLVVR
ncbi:MAG TPA: hypothetical protein VGL23_16460 [Chloroflexota bacterium]